MCRDNNHNGRRCPSDTSEARTLRRRNSSARSSYAPLAVEPVEPKYLPVPAQLAPVSVESVRADIEELNRLGQSMLNGGATNQEVLVAYDQQLAQIGAGVEALAESKYGALPDADFRKAYDDAFFQRLHTAASREMTDLEVEERKLRKKLDLLTSDKGRMSYLEEVAEWKKQDPELFDTWSKKNRELNDLYDAEEASGAGKKHIESDPYSLASHVLEERSEALKAALTAVGVKFADPDTLRVSADSHKVAVKHVTEALAYYPQSWVDASNDAQENGLELRLKSSKARAHYQHAALQNTFVTHTEGRIHTKPADWRPDPHDLEESAYMDLNGETSWTDPKSGEVLMASSGVRMLFKLDGSVEETVDEGVRHWLKIKYDYKQQDKAPRGDSWERIEIREEALNKDGVYGPTGKMVPYYRKPKTWRESDTQGFKSELTINPDDKAGSHQRGLRVSLHEFAHRVEATTPAVAVMEDTFLRRRTGRLPLPDGTKPKADDLTEIYPGTKEEGYKDNFPDHYMGKVYEGADYREILSTGMEALFGGSFGGLTGNTGWKADPDYKKFILGVLASSVASSR